MKKQLEEEALNRVINEFGLSPRQKAVVALLFKGLGDKQIIAELGISLSTHRAHMSRIFRKLGVRDRHDVLLCIFQRSRDNCTASDCPLCRGEKPL